MTIEFHCPHCDKLLKTPDDKAGVRANCPGCGQTVTVPDPAHEAAHADASFGAGQSAVAAPDLPEAEQAPSAAEDTKPCPMCGASIKKAATRCRFCGETLVHRPTGAWQPTRIDAGEILSRAWEIYKAQFGMVLGVTIAFFAIQFGVQIAEQIVQTSITFAVAGAGGAPRPGANPAPFLLAVYGPMFFFMLVNLAVTAYLQAGFHKVLLRVARGEQVEFTELFSGREYFLRYLGGMFLFQIMATVGFLLLIIPGIIVTLMLWPFTYVIIDRNVGVFESYRLAHEATSGNYMSVFVLGLAAVGISLAGLLACGVGLIFAAPLTSLLFAVAYCGMTGQLGSRQES